MLLDKNFYEVDAMPFQELIGSVSVFSIMLTFFNFNIETELSAAVALLRRSAKLQPCFL